MSIIAKTIHPPTLTEIATKPEFYDMVVFGHCTPEMHVSSEVKHVYRYDGKDEFGQPKWTTMTNPPSIVHQTGGAWEIRYELEGDQKYLPRSGPNMDVPPLCNYLVESKEEEKILLRYKINDDWFQYHSGLDRNDQNDQLLLAKL